MIRKGDIYYADLDPGIGSEQTGKRPVLIIQNDVGNQYSPTTIAVMLTSRNTKKRLPTHVYIEPSNTGLTKNTIVMLEQIRTIDKKRLGIYIGHVESDDMKKVDRAAMYSLGIIKHKKERNK